MVSHITRRSVSRRSLDLAAQPWLGFASAILIVTISLVVSVALPPTALVGWVGLALTAMIPALIAQTLVKETGDALRQPARGGRDLAEVALVGAVALGVALAIFAPDRSVPSPYVMMPLMACVPITLWQILLFETWPLRSLFLNHRARRLSILTMTGILVAMGDRHLVSYDAVTAGGYHGAALSPRHSIDVRALVTLLISSAAVVMALQGFDFWPVEMLGRRLRLVFRQPWRGLYGLVIALGVASIMQLLSVHLFGMTIGRLQVQISVSFLFGMFVLMVMFQGRPFVGQPQPARGAWTVVVAGSIACAAYPLYRLAGRAALRLHGGPLAVDPDAWTATAMLAVTFPAMAVFADLFEFWPFRRSR